MRNKNKTTTFSFLAVFVLLPSCFSDTWPDEASFFEKFRIWQDDKSLFVYETQGRFGQFGSANILIDGEYRRAEVFMCQPESLRSPSEVSVLIDEKDYKNKKTGKAALLRFSKRRVKKSGGGYYKDRLELYNCINETGSDEWDDKSILLISSPIPQEHLDARLFEMTKFINDENHIEISPKNYHQTKPLEWETEVNNKSYTLTFGENRTFIFFGEGNASGTYTPTTDNIAFDFETDEIFGKEGQDIVFAYEF